MLFLLYANQCRLRCSRWKFIDMPETFDRVINILDINVVGGVRAGLVN